MKRYKIRILLNSGTTGWFADEIIISNLENEGGTSNYIFCDDEGLYKYYPVANTIIEELEPLHPEL